MPLKTFIYDNIEYTYYFNGSTPFLGSDTNQKSAIDRSIDGTLSLPNFINDGDKLYPLEYLSAYSFYACSLSHLTLPNTVKGIAGGSFESMRNLISIDLSQCKITYIPGFLFSNAVQLETILLLSTNIRKYWKLFFPKCPKSEILNNLSKASIHTPNILSIWLMWNRNSFLLWIF